jgi:hypothetical protein
VLLEIQSPGSGHAQWLSEIHGGIQLFDIPYSNSTMDNKYKINYIHHSATDINVVRIYFLTNSF